MTMLNYLPEEKKKTAEEILKLLDGYSYQNATQIINAVTTALETDKPKPSLEQIFKVFFAQTPARPFL